MILEICKLKLYFINIPTLYNGEENITGEKNNYEDQGDIVGWIKDNGEVTTEEESKEEAGNLIFQKLYLVLLNFKIIKMVN